MSDLVADGEAKRKAGAMHPVEDKPAARLMRFLPIALIACGLATGYALGWHEYLSLDYLARSRTTLMDFRMTHPVMAPAAFFVAYVLAVAFSFPAASVLTVFAGFLFGWLYAGALVAVAATIGATILFLAARSAFGDALRGRLGQKLDAFRRGFEDDAFSYLLILRLAPVFPFFIVNIAPAFCDVKLRTYVSATFLGILPGTFAYAYLGEGVDSVLAAAQAVGGEVSLGDLVTPKISLAFAGLALVAAIPVILKRFGKRRAA